MKNKILLTSALALAISVPAMAADPTPTTTVTSTSSCTETTLGTATGPVDIEADWQANTINLTWDANNGTVSGGSEQCTYDGTFTLPTSITRTGYEFAGWKVVQAACFISDYDVANTPTAFGSIALDGDSSHDVYEGGATASTYGISNKGEWGVTLASRGKVTGKAVCVASIPADISYVNDVFVHANKEFNITEATAAMGAEKAGILQQAFSLLETDEETDAEAAGNLVYSKLLMTDSAPTGTGGQYCYCEASSYTSSTGETCTAASRWGFLLSFGSALDCASSCAEGCAGYAQYYSSIRAGLFGSGN